MHDEIVEAKADADEQKQLAAIDSYPNADQFYDLSLDIPIQHEKGLIVARTLAAKPVATPTNFPVLKDKGVLQAVEEYCAAQAAWKMAKSRMDSLKPIITAAMGGAPVAYCGVRVLTHSIVAGLPETANVVITKDMIGTVIPGKRGKAGYEMLRIQ